MIEKLLLGVAVAIAGAAFWFWRDHLWADDEDYRYDPPARINTDDTFGDEAGTPPRKEQ